jgi:hypothetical protein
MYSMFRQISQNSIPRDNKSVVSQHLLQYSTVLLDWMYERSTVLWHYYTSSDSALPVAYISN